MAKKKIPVIIVSCLLAVAVLVTAAVVVVNIPKVKFFHGDRITGTFTMTVNGEEYIPDIVTVKHDVKGNQRITVNGKKFSIKGGKYGGYHIGFDLNNKELAALTGDAVFKSYPAATTLDFLYMNSNWWNITSIKIDVKMTKETDGWAVDEKIKYTEQQEDGTQKEDAVNIMGHYTGEDIQTQFGL